MGEVCFALQRDLQPPPPDLPPSFLPFCCICGSPEPNSCRSGRRGGLFFSFRLPMRCRVCWVLLQSVGLEGGRVARLQCLAELQSNHRGSVCFCAAAVLCVGVRVSVLVHCFKRLLVFFVVVVDRLPHQRLELFGDAFVQDNSNNNPNHNDISFKVHPFAKQCEGRWILEFLLEEIPFLSCTVVNQQITSWNSAERVRQ